MLLERGVRGSSGSPKSNPISFKQAFTGIGFTSKNNEFIRFKESNCISFAFSKFPSKKLCTKSCVKAGLTFERTEITPIPPKDNIGKI